MVEECQGGAKASSPTLTFSLSHTHTHQNCSYHDQLAMLVEGMAQEQHDVRIREKAEKRVSHNTFRCKSFPLHGKPTHTSTGNGKVRKGTPPEDGTRDQGTAQVSGHLGKRLHSLQTAGFRYVV